MKYKAVGYKSGKLYAAGESKAEVMRKLQEKYPTLIYRENSKAGTNIKVYPEEIRIIKEENN